MLGTEIKNQLKPLFQELNSEIVFKISKSSHESQEELLEMLKEISELSFKLSWEILDQESPVPSFQVGLKNKKSTIVFTGIPNGHEFSSLILAILNLDGKGKLPDENLQKRIQKLKGSIKLRTFISLSCENCPDVVQALNQMSLYHPNFLHEMVDGALLQEEVHRLGIQGVPSVVVGDTLIHSGKASFLDLVNTLEKYFGVDAKSENRHLGNYDVVIVGGGPAGASAAIYAARKGLKTAMVVEKMGGQVRDTKGIENLIGTKYLEGQDLSAQLFEHISSYSIDILEHRRVESVESQKKILKIEGGESINYGALIIATGAKWKELGVPGEKEYLGRGVAFCPHCDGPFYKGKKVAVIGGGNSGVEAAIDLSQIAKEVVLLEFADQLKADQVLIDKMKTTSNISFYIGAKTEQFISKGKNIVALEYTERATQEKKQIELDGVFVQIGLSPNSAFLKGVVEMNKYGEIMIDTKGKTSDAHIFAAGDVTNVPYKQIIISMGEGAKAALAAFELLKIK